MGHKLTMPNGYDSPGMEEEMKNKSKEESENWKKEMLKKDYEIISRHDAILVLNLEKKGIQNYIGGATFLEIHNAFLLNKKIFLYNPIPDCIFADEIRGMTPIILEGNIKIMNTFLPKKFFEILEKQRAKYQNAYKPWTGEEDIELEKLGIEKSKTIKELSVMFGRNPGAIRSRLKKFGL